MAKELPPITERKALPEIGKKPLPSIAARKELPSLSKEAPTLPSQITKNAAPREQLPSNQKQQLQEKVNAKKDLHSQAAMLGLEPPQLVTGGEAFKKALAANVPEAPTIKGALSAVAETHMKALKNVIPSAWRLIKDSSAIFLHPVDTATSLGGLAAGLVEKLIPGEQGQEQYVDALVDNYKERFGSVDKLIAAYEEDPVGIMADSAGLLVGAGGIAKVAGKGAKVARLTRTAETLKKAGNVATKAGAAFDPLSIMGKANKFLAKPLIASAEKQISQVLGATKAPLKRKTKKIISELTAMKPIAFSIEGFKQKMGEKVSLFSDAIENWITENGVEGSTKTDLIIENLNKLLDETKTKIPDEYVDAQKKAAKAKQPKGDLVVEIGDAGDSMTISSNSKSKGEVVTEIINDKARDAAGRGVIDTIKKHAKAFGGEIPNNILLKIKRQWGKMVANKGGFDSKDVADQIDFERNVVETMTEELAKTNPDLNKLNKSFAFFKDVYEVLEATAERKTGQPGGFSKRLAVGTAAATAESAGSAVSRAGVAGAVVSLLSSSLYKTLSAAMKTTLAEALVSRNTSAFYDIVRQIEKVSKEQRGENK